MIDDSARVAVIVPVLNGRDFIAACLNSVRAQRVAGRVLVIDDASTDGSAELVERNFPDVTLLRNAANLGFASAVNAGVRHTQDSEYVLVLNQDTELGADCVGQLLDAFAALPGAGIVGCKILCPDGVTLQHCGGWLRQPGAFGEHFGRDETDQGQYDLPREVEYVTGAALMLSRAALDVLGGLETRLSRAYYEDTDLCFRARAAGFEVWYWPWARLTHFEHSSFSELNYQRQLYVHSGRIGFALRHLTPVELTAFGDAEPKACAADGLLDDVLARSRAYLSHLVNLDVVRRSRETIYSRTPSMSTGDEVWEVIIQRLLLAREVALQRSFEILAISPPPLPIRLPETPAPDSIGAASAPQAGPWIADEEAPSALEQIEAELVPAPEVSDIPTPAGLDTILSSLEELEPKLRLREFRFSSRAPVIGGLIAAVRRAWHGVAGRWAMLDTLQQQSEVNRELASATRTLASQHAALAARHFELNARHAALETRHFALDRNFRQWIAYQTDAMRGLSATMRSLEVLLGAQRAESANLARAMTDQLNANLDAITAQVSSQQVRYDALLREITRHENDLIEYALGERRGSAT
jgi:GT2 family glycosyltransferase